MTELKGIEKNVRFVLETFPPTRSDDFLLVGTTWMTCYGVKPGENWVRVLSEHAERGLPSWESITRIRRKLQAEAPELRGTKKREAVRMGAQVDYMNYAEE